MIPHINTIREHTHSALNIFWKQSWCIIICNIALTLSLLSFINRIMMWNQNKYGLLKITHVCFGYELFLWAWWYLKYYSNHSLSAGWRRTICGTVTFIPSGPSLSLQSLWLAGIPGPWSMLGPLLRTYEPVEFPLNQRIPQDQLDSEEARAAPCACERDRENVNSKICRENEAGQLDRQCSTVQPILLMLIKYRNM